MKTIVFCKRSFNVFVFIPFFAFLVLVMYLSWGKQLDQKQPYYSTNDNEFDMWLKKWGPAMKTISKAHGKNHDEGSLFQHNGRFFIKVPQIFSYYQLIHEHKASISRVCETGFFEGHSALMWSILFDGNIDIISFDLCDTSRCTIGIEAVKAQFPNVRLTVIKGDSRKTVPEFSAKNPDIKCNLISIDGGHVSDVPKKDIENMKHMAANKHFIVVDDANIHSNVPWLNTPGRAWEESVAEEIICPIHECQEVCYPLIPALPMKFCIGKYCKIGFRSKSFKNTS